MTSGRRFGPEILRHFFLADIISRKTIARGPCCTDQLQGYPVAPIHTTRSVIGEPTFADAILDRIVYNAYRLELEGAS